MRLFIYLFVYLLNHLLFYSSKSTYQFIYLLFSSLSPRSKIILAKKPLAAENTPRAQAAGKCVRSVRDYVYCTSSTERAQCVEQGRVEDMVVLFFFFIFF